MGRAVNSILHNYLIVTWLVGSFCTLAGLIGGALISEYDEDARFKSRLVLALIVGGLLAPLAVLLGLPAAIVLVLRRAVRRAELPSLLPGPKEQSPGQLSVAPAQRGGLSQPRGES